MGIIAYSNLYLFESCNKQAVTQQSLVLQKFGRYPKRNEDFWRKNTYVEKAMLDDKENLPIWGGGKFSIDGPIK